MRKLDTGSLTESTFGRELGSRAQVDLAPCPGIVGIHPKLPSAPPSVWRVSGPVVVGRGRRAGIRLDDAFVSRAHAELEANGQGLVVRELGSRYGTVVAGQPVGREPILAPFDSVLRVGDSLFLVVRDIERYRAPPRQIAGAALGVTSDAWAGPVLSEIWDQATRAAFLRYPVLVLGESGSGKENIAHLVHAALGSEHPFVGLNVAAVPDALFEAELFGHERGAFTGAAGCRAGAFREAEGGVLFLDEVAELRLDLQAKLLRAIDPGTIRPLGSKREVPTNVRIVAATSQDLRQACDEGRFRSDLYFRLSGVVIQVPPLRTRPDDILLLASFTLASHAPELRLSADAAERLALGTWNGNVRALQSVTTHAIARASLDGSSEILPSHLPEFTVAIAAERELSEQRIRVAMAGAAGVAARAAEILGVSRTTFYKSCRRLGIDTASLRAEPASVDG